MLKKSRIAASLAALASLLSAEATIPLDYYSSLQGLSGPQLKEAVYRIVGNSDGVDMLSYGSGNGATWWGFYITDRIVETNEVIDRYSNDVRYFGNRGASVSGMNIEHSFAKSWWGGAKNNAYKDLFNLMPCEEKINSSKSNYPMGVVKTVTKTNGCTKIGDGAGGEKYWEPADKWKGDFARGYMYMATAYQNLTWSGAQALAILENNSYPTLKKDAVATYINWARTDAVTEEEAQRCDDVHSLQGNRNPFIDFPNLMEYIWGDSVATLFDVNTTVKSADFTGSVSGIEDAPVLIYECSFLGDTGDCTIENNRLGQGLTKVWSNDATYGWKASAAKGSSANLTRYESDASLVTPELNLEKYRTAYFTFEHACKFAENPSAVLSVRVRESDGTETDLKVKSWPSGKNWNFVSSGKVDLSPYVGQKVNIVFNYTSTTAEACTWEIKNMEVYAAGHTSGVEEIIIPDENEQWRFTPDDLQDPSKCIDIEVYTIDGRRIEPENAKGLIIVRKGNNVVKLFVR